MAGAMECSDARPGRSSSERVEREDAPGECVAVRSAPPVPAPVDLPRGVVAADPAMWRVYRQARRVAGSGARVLVRGETGTGKEAVMRAIHSWSERPGRCVVINCGGLPPSLIEAELFGHERGAFTGAVQRRSGVFEQADHGTLCLDEIGELPLSAQAALLRVLETGRFHRVGAVEEIEVDVRVIAATHRDLRELVEQGHFREDLYYRLDAITLSLPPLRERPRDVEVLARHFLATAQRTWGHRVESISQEAMACLLAHGWPGNVRELRNAIEFATTMQEREHHALQVSDLPAALRAGAACEESSEHHGAAAGDFRAGEGYHEQMRRFSATLLRAALRHTGGRSGKSAELLGLPLRTFQRKLKEHGIKRRG